MATQYWQRVLELARRGQSAVAPNPRVGALVVHQGQILGEGWHQRYGAAHAEAQALAEAARRAPERLSSATLYVSLEPCNHTGKTPPCTRTIVEQGVRDVRIGSCDPNPQMQGQSLAWLRQQGVHVQLAEDERPFRALNRAFWINQQEGRPYITLKWAETANGIMGHSQGARLHITGAASNRLVHWLRAEHPAIMIGRATAQRDQPSLSTRYYPGPSPTRVVWDPELRLPATLPLFRQPGRSLLLNRHRAGEADGLTYYIPAQGSFGAVDSLMRELYTQFGIGSVLVEGGRRLLQQFLDHHCWDAIYRFRGLSNAAGDVSAPVIHQGFQPYQTHLLNSDILQIYYHYETGTIQHSSAEAYH